MKKITLLFFSISLCSVLASQSLTIRLETGFHKGIFNISDLNAGTIGTQYKLNNPDINLTITKEYKNNILFSSGIGYYNNSLNLSFFRYNHSPQTLFHTTNRLYSAFRIPIMIGKSFKLNDKFDFNVLLGLQAEIVFNTKDYNTVSIHSEDIHSNNYTVSYKIMSDASFRKYNLMLTNKIELAYKINSDFKINIFASYSSGLLNNSWSADLFFTSSDQSNNGQLNTNVNYGEISSNGSSINIGLGIAYIFNN